MSTGYIAREHHRNVSSAVTKTAVTQATLITNPVTVNASAGVITTVVSTQVHNSTAPETFTVTCPACLPTSLIQFRQIYTGTTGTPATTTPRIADGEFDITITNSHGSEALNAAVQIIFAIL